MKKNLLVTSEKEKEISTYVIKKRQELLKAGFPSEKIWLTECETIEKAEDYYGYVITLNNPDNHKFCLYYHERGDILKFETFDDYSTFERACVSMSNYFKN
jgi:hypothetical protein